MAKKFVRNPKHEYSTETCLCGYRYTVDITATNEKYETVVVEGDEEFDTFYVPLPAQRHVLCCPKCGTLKILKE